MTREQQIEAQREYSALVKQRDRLLRERAAQRRSARSKALAEAAAAAISDVNAISDALQDAVEQKPKKELSFALLAEAKRRGISPAELDKRVSSVVQIRTSAPRPAPRVAKTIITPVAKAAAKPVALAGERRLVTGTIKIAI